MTRFRTKPVVVEAVKYLGHGNLENSGVPDWMWDAFENGTLMPTNGDDPLYVNTYRGKMTLSPGSYLVRDSQGEIFPCEANSFEASYEKEDEE